jgi:hypothetical protein
VWWIAFAISAAVHVLAVLLYSVGGSLQTERLAVPGKASAGSAVPEGMQVIRIVETSEPTKAEPPRKRATVPTPKQKPIVQPGQPNQATSGAAKQEGTANGEGLSAAERLRPNPKNRRLWAPVDPALTRLTREQRMELALSGRLAAWEDSVAAEDSAAAAATDWTFTDKAGNKWGVTPGQLHLGGLTLPLPFNFGTSPGHRDENELRTWEWSDIQRQAAEGAIRAGWKERAQAIRARRDKERAAAKADSSGVKH